MVPPARSMPEPVLVQPRPRQHRGQEARDQADEQPAEEVPLHGVRYQRRGVRRRRPAARRESRRHLGRCRRPAYCLAASASSDAEHLHDDVPLDPQLGVLGPDDDLVLAVLRRHDRADDPGVVRTLVPRLMVASSLLLFLLLPPAHGQDDDDPEQDASAPIMNSGNIGLPSSPPGCRRASCANRRKLIGACRVEWRRHGPLQSELSI